jgi:hypothetical protein
MLSEALARRDRLPTEFQPDVEQIAQYERKAIAQRYAALLRSIVREESGAVTQPELTANSGRAG